jgi:hypothetical protein
VGHQAAQSQPPAAKPVAAPPIFVSGRQVEYQTRTIGGETYGPLSLLAGPLGFSIATDPKDQSLRIEQPGKPESPKVVLIVGEDDRAVTLLADAGIAVTRKGEFPPSLDGYSAVWITSPAGLSPTCRKMLAEFVSAGGGLVTSDDIPAALAGTAFKYRNSDLDIADLEPICDWFGARAIWRGGRLVRSRGRDDVLMKFPKTLLDRRLDLEVGTHPYAGCLALEVDSRNARSLVSTPSNESYVYTHTYGAGRIYWQFTQYGQRNFPDPPKLIPAAVRWVAKMK